MVILSLVLEILLKVGGWTKGPPEVPFHKHVYDLCHTDTRS